MPDENEHKHNENEHGDTPGQDGKQPDKRPNARKPTTQQTVISIITTALIILLLGMMLFGRGDIGGQRTDELLTSDFTAAVQQHRVVEVDYTPTEYSVTGKYYPAATAGSLLAEGVNGAMNSMNSYLSNEKGGGVDGVQTTDISPNVLGEERRFTATYGSQGALDMLMAAHPEIRYTVKTPNGLVGTLLSLLPMLLLIGLMVFFFYQMSKANNQQMSFGRAKAKKMTEERPDVHFSDVAGCDEAVEEMREIRDFLANPEKYQDIGAKIPHGCLLVGPPGTGKTLLARAVAGEAEVPFFSISGSDFVEMFVGVGASRVRDLFNEAKAASPSIIFIDEIDAVGRQRGAGLGGGHDEREQTLNQLLVEMDGFDANTSVVLIAATNRADVLDPALLRPGRFDRQIVVDTPDIKGREKILEVHSKNKPLAQDVNLKEVAKLTPGFTGADLANLLNESALLTARRNKKVISMDEVRESMERVIAGPERKGRVIDAETRKTIAYHESGHALVGHMLEHADPVHKISIISRGRALGYTMSIPAEDKVMNSLREMHDQLAVLLGGRTAEEIFCEDITTGASNDLERATKIARSMVTQYGMSAELGAQIFGKPNHEVFLGRDYGNTQDYSDETARRIDDEVARIMKVAHDRAREVLMAHQDQMHLMANVLLERETVEGDACQALLDNRWDEYRAHEESEEGRRARHLAATTVVNQPEDKPAETEREDAGSNSGGSVAPTEQPVQPVQPVSREEARSQEAHEHSGQAEMPVEPQQPAQEPAAGADSAPAAPAQPVQVEPVESAEPAQPVQAAPVVPPQPEIVAPAMPAPIAEVVQPAKAEPAPATVKPARPRITPRRKPSDVRARMQASASLPPLPTMPPAPEIPRQTPRKPELDRSAGTAEQVPSADNRMGMQSPASSAYPMGQSQQVQPTRPAAYPPAGMGAAPQAQQPYCQQAPQVAPMPPMQQPGYPSVPQGQVPQGYRPPAPQAQVPQGYRQPMPQAQVPQGYQPPASQGQPYPPQGGAPMPPAGQVVYPPRPQQPQQSWQVPQSQQPDEWRQPPAQMSAQPQQRRTPSDLRDRKPPIR